MSLINDMLRDLDDRREGNHNSTNVGANLTAGETEPPSRKPQLLVLFGLVVLAAVFVFGWLPGGKKTPTTELALLEPVAPSSPQPEVSAASPANPPVVLEAQPLAELSNSNSITGVATEKVDAAISGVPSEENGSRLPAEQLAAVVPEIEEGAANIEQLLRAAREAVEKDRLTVPESASALSLYRQVLDSEPDNAEALAGIEAISLRYRQLLEAAKKEGEPSRMAFLVSRAETSGVPNLPLADYRQQLVLWQQSSKPALKATELVAVQELPPLSKSAEAVTFAKSSAGGKSPGIEKTLSTRDKQQVERQREAYQRGNYTAAIAGLETFVAGNPAADLSRRQLFDWYLEQNRLQEAQALAASATHNAVLQTWFQARVLVKQNQPAAARFLLEENDFNQLQAQWHSGIIDNRLYEDYNGLLAALFQKLGDHLLALEKYQLLVALNSEQPDYWLGFAISSDVLGLQARALAAYQQVLRLGPQTATVATYVKSRVDTLAATQDTRIAGAGGN